MTAYRVIVVGMGKRGLHHAAAFAANPRFELAGICSRDPARLAAAAARLGDVKTSTEPSELAGEVNRFVEHNKLEANRDEKALRSVEVAVSTVRHLGGLLGLFLQTGADAGTARDGSGELVGQLMRLLIDLRAESRKAKNFAMADTIRKRLTELGITLEDRSDGTIWRKE